MNSKLFALSMTLRMFGPIMIGYSLQTDWRLATGLVGLVLLIVGHEILRSVETEHLLKQLELANNEIKYANKMVNEIASIEDDIALLKTKPASLEMQ